LAAVIRAFSRSIFWIMERETSSSLAMVADFHMRGPPRGAGEAESCQLHGKPADGDTGREDDTGRRSTTAQRRNGVSVQRVNDPPVHRFNEIWYTDRCCLRCVRRKN
jgi:hypothetical protein